MYQGGSGADDPRGQWRPLEETGAGKLGKSERNGSVGARKRRRFYAVGGLLFAVLLIVAEEVFEVEFMGEALLGVLCIALIASSVSGDSGGATEVPTEDVEAARRLAKPSF